MITCLLRCPANEDVPDERRVAIVLPRMVGPGTTQLYVGYLGMNADTGQWKATGPAFLGNKAFVGLPVSPGNDTFYFHCRLSPAEADFTRDFHCNEATEYGPKMKHFRVSIASIIAALERSLTIIKRITDTVWLIPYELGNHSACDHDHGGNDTPTIQPVVIGPSHVEKEVDSHKAPAGDAAPSELPQKPNTAKSRASQKPRKVRGERYSPSSGH